MTQINQKCTKLNYVDQNNKTAIYFDVNKETVKRCLLFWHSLFKKIVKFHLTKTLTYVTSWGQI